MSLPNEWSADGKQLLQGGLDYFVEGLERLTEASALSPVEARRPIKYALLHLAAGAELILKARLHEADWTYVVAKIETADPVRFAAGRFESVGGKNLILRLRSHASVEITERAKQDLSHLRDMRNRAEHFVLRENARSTEAVAIRCLPHLIDFIEAECAGAASEASVEQELAKAVRLVAALRVGFQHAAGLARAQATGRASRGDAVFTCPECFEPTLVVDGGAECLNCLYTGGGPDAAARYVENVLGISGYEIETRGGSFPVEVCPECDGEALVLGIDEQRTACLNCGFTVDGTSFERCSSCNSILWHEGEDELPACLECMAQAWDRFG